MKPLKIIDSSTQSSTPLVLHEKERSNPHSIQSPLRTAVEYAVKKYLSELEGQRSTGLYNIVLAEIEIPLLKVALEYTNKNQSHAAQLLGLSRSTLRKKLKQCVEARS
jgi:Fis family transcriptional regulator